MLYAFTSGLADGFLASGDGRLDEAISFSGMPSRSLDRGPLRLRELSR